MQIKNSGAPLIVDAIQRVKDLDATQSLFCSNSTADRMAPELQRWLLAVIQAERSRREAGASEWEYPLRNLCELANHELAETALFALGVLECAASIASPTLHQAALAVAKVTLCCVIANWLAPPNQPIAGS